MKEPRLTIELVPRTVFHRNLRSAVPKKAWDRIRRQIYKRADYRCEICGGTGSNHPVECHETWEYDDAQNTQRLSGFKALCPACHEVKHAGLASAKGRYEEAMQHLAKVNDWSVEKAKEYTREQFDIWQKRSQQDWEQDVSLLEEAPYSDWLEEIEINLQEKSGT